MSKSSGLFLSLLLVTICLWINICRYPAVWVMINGKSATKITKTTKESNQPTESSQNSQPSQSKENSLNPEIESSNFVAETHNKLEQKIIPVSNSEYETVDSNNSTVNSTTIDQQNQQKNTEYARYQSSSQNAHRENFRNASLTQPVSENEQGEFNSQKQETESKTKSNDSSLNNSSNFYRSSYQENVVKKNGKRDENETKMVVHSGSFPSIQCYSLYQAVGSSDTKPMNFETPNYLNENSSIVPCSGSQIF